MATTCLGPISRAHLFRLFTSLTLTKMAFLYWLGTKRSSATFAEPCQDASLAVATQSDSTHGTGSTAFSRGAVTSNYICAGSQPYWFQIEFKTVAVQPSYYTFRTDTNGAHHAVRNWKVEASNDGQQWVVLSTHSNDTKLAAQASAAATWPVAKSDGFFRFLRITQTGPNSGGNQYFMMCGFEVYGKVRVE